MVTLEQVDEMAMALPDVTVGTRWGNRTWMVGKHGFAWERPFSKADIKRFGTEPVPEGPIIGVRVIDLEDKEALLQNPPKGVFTIEHFKGYPAVLVQLKVASRKTVRELLEDAHRTVR